MDERYDMVRSVRDKRYIYIRNYMPHRPYGQYVGYMFQTQTTQVWHRMFQEGKLNEAQSHFWKIKPAEELYDLQNDPDEVHNLADSPEHQDVLARLQKAHQDWAREIKDVGFLSEWEMHERSQGTTPYEMGHDAEKYDFDAIFAAANLAASLKEDELPEIIKLLDDKDPGVRYWAAVGVLASGEAGLVAAGDRIVKALKDENESPIVRITAAEVLGRYGKQEHTQDVLDVLLQYASPEANVFLGIATWNVLDQLDEVARPVKEQLQAMSPTPKQAPPRTDGYAARLKEKTLQDLK
jgi:uncharacterized sulfatase